MIPRPGVEKRNINRPGLKTLQEFVNPYFCENPPRVEWFEFVDGTSGRAFMNPKVNVIRISPSMPQKWEGCEVGHETDYEPLKQFNFLPEELYFMVLLHEIGHFKIRESGKFRAPKYFESLKKRLQKDYPGNPSRQFYEIENYMKQMAGESDVKYHDRLIDFESFLRYGVTCSSHCAVEDWARDEFEKKRNEIDLILYSH